MPARVPCRGNPPRGYWGTGGAAWLLDSVERFVQAGSRLRKHGGDEEDRRMALGALPVVVLRDELLHSTGVCRIPTRMPM